MKTGAVDVLRLCGGALLLVGVLVFLLSITTEGIVPAALGWAALAQGLVAAPLFFGFAALLEGVAWLLEEVEAIRDEVAGKPAYLGSKPREER